MLNGKKLIVVMPAYNAGRTLEQTYRDIPKAVVDEVILVDDASRDETVARARALGIKTVVHLKNTGYGGNQKTCYREALTAGAGIVVMLHPDYQYDPRLVPSLAGMIAYGTYDVVLGSRILAGSALKGGMPLYKYIANRWLTLIQNLMMGRKLSEYHTGYRAFSSEVLAALPLENNSDDFVFDNEMIAQAVYFGFRVGELSVPAKYFTDASSINFCRSVQYGFGVLWTAGRYLLAKLGLARFRIFAREGGRLRLGQAQCHV